jgi:hypothetical protein
MTAPAALPRDAWLAWGPFLAASVHIVEEFIFPGGFSEWYRRYRSAAAVSFTRRFAVGINPLLLFPASSYRCRDSDRAARRFGSP